MTEKTCFVIAPIGEQDSDIRKRSDAILKHIIGPAVSDCGYKAIRADQISEPGMITTKVIQHIVNDPLVIADLTGRNPNVFYELAIRHSITKPLIQIIEKAEQIPFDVAGMRTIQVDPHDMDSVEEAKKEIIAQIKALEDDSIIFETPISVSLDLQMLKQSESLEQRSLADVLSTITELSSSINDLTIEQKGWIGKDYPELALKYTEVSEKYQNLKHKSLVNPIIFKNFDDVVPALENKLNELMSDTSFENPSLKIRVLGVCFHKSFPIIKRYIEENCVSGKRIEIRLSLLDKSSSIIKVLDKIWNSYYQIYEAQQNEFIERISKIENANISLKISKYSHMPNWHGIMINKSHLYLSACVWNSEQVMTAGENHYVYYKKDTSWLHNQKILQFRRWFDYGRFNGTTEGKYELIFDTNNK